MIKNLRRLWEIGCLKCKVETFEVDERAKKFDERLYQERLLIYKNRNNISDREIDLYIREEVSKYLLLLDEVIINEIADMRVFILGLLTESVKEKLYMFFYENRMPAIETENELFLDKLNASFAPDTYISNIRVYENSIVFSLKYHNNKEIEIVFTEAMYHESIIGFSDWIILFDLGCIENMWVINILTDNKNISFSFLDCFIKHPDMIQGSV